MFFILSKVLLFLLVPTCWVIVLFVWSLLTKKVHIKKRLLIAMLVIFVVFTNPFLFRTIAIAWQPKPVQLPEAQQYELAILLGGMSGFETNGIGHFGEASDRFIQAANLYHTGKVQKILITGGTGALTQNEPPEAVFLQQSLRENGVPDSAIIIESRSRNTYENAVYSRPLIDSLKARTPYVLVTSARHMPRSERVFRKAGYAFISYPCDYRFYPVKPSLITTILPDMALFNEWAMLLKEIVGTVAYQLTGKA